MRKKLTVFFIAASLIACTEQSFESVSKLQSVSALATYNNKVDILWVVDNSSTTMERHQNRIAGYMSQFHQGLIDSKTDYRVAATTMDGSSGGEQGDLAQSGLIVTPNSEDSVKKLESLVRLGGSGNNFEVGLSSMRSSLEKNKDNFLREDALLVIVFISDDQDVSLGAVSEYYNFLNELKGENTNEKQNWISNFIGVTDITDSRCRTFGNYSGAGLRYMELSKYSNGVVDTICYTEFDSFMNQITIRLQSVLNEFIFENWPLVETISVILNGSEVPQDEINGWVYKSETKTLLLLGDYKPKPNDIIEIKYELNN